MDYINGVNNTPTFCSVTGEVSHPVELYYNVKSLSAISIIFKITNGKSFNNESAYLYVSNSKDGSYTLLRMLSLGLKDLTSYGITYENQGVFGNPLFFAWLKIVAPAIDGVQVKVVCSGR